MSEERTAVAEKQNPYLLASNGKKMLTLVGIFVAIFGSLMQSNTMSTLLALAAAEIGGVDYYSLASTTSGVLGIIVMPLWGYLCAKSPHLKPHLFFIAIIAGAVAVLARAIAPNMMVIVVTSTLYGFVSCGLYVVGYSMIRDIFPPQKAGTYLGACGTIMMIGALVGPVLGGVIMQVLGWRVMCNIIWPLMTVGAVMVFMGVRVKKEDCAHMASAAGAFDVPGTIVMAVFLGALVMGLSLGTSFLPFGSMGSNIVFAVAVVAAVAFAIVINKKGDSAIVPKSALKDRNTICFSIANLFSSIANMALFFFLPLYVLNVMGLDATKVGIIMACYSVCGLFLSPIYGKMIGKSGNARNVLLVTIVFRVVVGAGFLLLVKPDSPMILLCVLMLIGGVYNCAGGSVFSAGPQIQLPESIRAQGNSVIQLMQTLGSSLGIAVFTACIGIAGIQGGFQVAIIVSIVCSLIAAAAAIGLKKLPAPAGKQE